MEGLKRSLGLRKEMPEVIADPVERETLLARIRGRLLLHANGEGDLDRVSVRDRQ